MAIPPDGGYRSVVYQPEIFDRVVREMLEETGRVRLLDETEFFDAEISPDKTRIESILARKADGGVIRVHAAVFIDATGSILLCQKVGCATRRGVDPRSLYGESLAPETPTPQLNALTRCYRIERSPNPKQETIAPEEKTDFPKCAYITGWLDGTRMINMLPTLPGSALFDLGYDECMKRSELIVRNHWHWLQQQADFSEYELTEIAPMLGIREGERVVARYMLRQQDLDATWEGQTHPDRIAVADHPCDVHGEGGALIPVRSAYGIPYRCLIPEGTLTNLLVACRGAGMSRIAAASCRLQRTMIQLGHAAGTAAAWAARNKCPVDQIDIPALVEKMDARNRYPVRDGKFLAP